MSTTDKSMKQIHKLFHEAAQQRDLYTLKIYLERNKSNKDFDIDLRNSEGVTPLITAIIQGNVANVELLLNNGANPNAKNKLGESAVFICVNYAKRFCNPNVKAPSASKDDAEVVNSTVVEDSLNHQKYVKTLNILLRQPNLEINNIDNNGSAALLDAAFGGDAIITNLLLGHDAINKEIMDRDSRETAFLGAAKNGHVHVLEILLSKGANTRANNVNNENALMLAAENSKIDVVNYLLENTDLHTTLKQANVYEQTIMDLAQSSLSKGKTKVIKRLEELGAKTFSAFNQASNKRDIKVKLNKQNSAAAVSSTTSINPQSASASASATSAATKGKNGSDKTFIIFGRAIGEFGSLSRYLGRLKQTDYFNIDRCNPNDGNKTALMLACIAGRFRNVECLLENGADPKLIDAKGKTALIYAEECGDKNIIDLLNSIKPAAASASSSTLDKQTKSAKSSKKKDQDTNGKAQIDNRSLNIYDLVNKSSLPSYIARNRNKPWFNINVQHPDHHDKTPLMRACRDKNLAQVKLLLEHGADTSLKNSNGRDAHYFAMKSGIAEIIDLLKPSLSPENSHNISALSIVPSAEATAHLTTTASRSAFSKYNQNANRAAGAASTDKNTVSMSNGSTDPNKPKPIITFSAEAAAASPSPMVLAAASETINSSSNTSDSLSSRVKVLTEKLSNQRKRKRELQEERIQLNIRQAELVKKLELELETESAETSALEKGNKAKAEEIRALDSTVLSSVSGSTVGTTATAAAMSTETQAEIDSSASAAVSSPTSSAAAQEAPEKLGKGEPDKKKPRLNQ